MSAIIGRTLASQFFYQAIRLGIPASMTTITTMPWALPGSKLYSKEVGFNYNLKFCSSTSK